MTPQPAKHYAANSGLRNRKRTANRGLRLAKRSTTPNVQHDGRGELGHGIRLAASQPIRLGSGSISIPTSGNTPHDGCSLRTFGATLRHHIIAVHARRSGKKMRRITAPRGVALVKNPLSMRDITKSQHERKSVCEKTASAKPELTIASLCAGASPQPTRTERGAGNCPVLVYLRPETERFFFSELHKRKNRLARLVAQPALPAHAEIGKSSHGSSQPAKEVEHIVKKEASTWPN